MGAEPDRLERSGLAASDRILVEVGDRVLVHAMKIEPRAEPQERAPEADRRSLQKHEFAWDRQPAALRLQGAHHLADLAAAVFRPLGGVGCGAHAIVENGPAHESRPKGHRLDRAGRELGEAPHLERMRGSRLIVRLESAIELYDAKHEPRREDAHAAIVEQIYAINIALSALAGCVDRIDAMMRMAVQDAVAQERAPPGVEQPDGDRVTRFLRGVLEGGESFAVEPLHRQKPARRQALVDPGNADERAIGEHDPIEASDL